MNDWTLDGKADGTLEAKADGGTVVTSACGLVGLVDAAFFVQVTPTTLPNGSMVKSCIGCKVVGYAWIGKLFAIKDFWMDWMSTMLKTRESLTWALQSCFLDISDNLVTLCIAAWFLELSSSRTIFKQTEELYRVASLAFLSFNFIKDKKFL